MMLLNARLVLALGLCFGVNSLDVSPANARVILKERVTYYDVKGKSGREIFKDMIENGPRVGRAVNNHALATTEYKYDIENIDVEVKNGRCVPVNFDIILRVKYTYPRWKSRASANRNTRRAWNVFNDTVIWHEKQHVKIAVELAEDYERVLKRTRFPARDDCNVDSLGFKWRVGMANLKHNRKQRRFDRKDLKPGGRGYEAQLNLIKAE